MVSIGIFFALFIVGLIVVIGAGCLMLGIVVFFSTIDYISAQIRHSIDWSPSRAPNRVSSQPFRPVSRIYLIVWCLLPPTVVLSAFIGISGAANREWTAWNRLPPPPVPAPPATPQNTTALPQAPHLVKPAKLITQSIDESSQPIGSTASAKPAWVFAGDFNQGDLRKTVLASRLWSSEAEAIEDLKVQTAELIGADFQKHHPGLLDPRGDKYFDNQRIIDWMVKQRYSEQTERDFGKFTAPMYRVWWQVEVSPVVRDELYPHWKSAAIQNRIVFVGAILAMLTLIANTFDLYGNLRRSSTAGRLQAAALCAMPVLAWTAVELLIASHLIL